jgi:glutaredoxin 3
MAKVTMYSTEWCPYCKGAEQLLERKGVKELNKISVDRNPAERETMIARSGRRTVPQIFVGDTHVGGFDDLSSLDREGRLDALLAQ